MRKLLAMILGLTILAGCAGQVPLSFRLPLPPEPKCEEMEIGFWPETTVYLWALPTGGVKVSAEPPIVNEGEPEPIFQELTVRIITTSDLEKYADCFRQYRIGYEVGKSNTEIVNRPEE